MLCTYRHVIRRRFLIMQINRRRRYDNDDAWATIMIITMFGQID